MPYYAQEFKEKTARQLLPPHSKSVASVSRETGVSEPTLYAWKKQFAQQVQPAGAPRESAPSWNAKDRLNAVIATAAMSEVERSAWCREQGLYVEQLDTWREAFEGMDDDKAQASRSNTARERKSLAKLQKELERKDTYLPSTVKGQFWRLYMIVDIYSRAIVGWEVHAEELASHAAVLVSRACLRQQVRRDQLVLHADNGSPMKGATMLATLQRLGVMPSFSRPSVSDDNPYSEALFRTLKYTPAYPDKPFDDVQQARQWVQRFVHWYNEEHCHSAIRFVTPSQRHAGLDAAILQQRHGTYIRARSERPERWNGRTTRNWEPVAQVWLNPERE